MNKYKMWSFIILSLFVLNDTTAAQPGGHNIVRSLGDHGIDNEIRNVIDFAIGENIREGRIIIPERFSFIDNSDHNIIEVEGWHSIFVTKKMEEDKEVFKFSQQRDPSREPPALRHIGEVQPLSFSVRALHPTMQRIGDYILVIIDNKVNAERIPISEISFVFTGPRMNIRKSFFMNYHWEKPGFTKAVYVGADYREIMLEGLLNDGRSFVMTVEVPDIQLH